LSRGGSRGIGVNGLAVRSTGSTIGSIRNVAGIFVEDDLLHPGVHPFDEAANAWS
jgi:hypothetical protein